MMQQALRWTLALFVVATTAWSQATADLKIVVLEGEDGVNIIDKKTAVKPIVEVRDKNDLPVAGAVVTFVIIGEGRHVMANFGGNLRSLTVTTDSTGRATVAQLNPVGKGTIQIQVRASYQGQTATTTIHQTNFANLSQAAKAGKSPSNSNANSSNGNSGNSGDTGNTGTSSSSGASSGGSTAGAGGTAAGGTAAGGAAAGGAAAGGGMGVGAAIGIGAAVAGGTVATVAAVKYYDDHKCDNQLNALQNGVNSISNSLTIFDSCLNAARTNAQVNACYNTWANSYQQNFLNPASAYCSCAGSSASAGISPEDKRAVQQAINDLRSVGFNPGSLPSCFQ